MITKEMIREGVDNKTITFVISPNEEHGTVAKIGEYWFYFGGPTAEEENPDEFLKNADMDDIVNDIYEALDDMIQDDPASAEYRYYEACLLENIRHWSEIRCTHLDELNQCWMVDAWHADLDEEEGSVIAIIDNPTGRVFYLDPLARVDKYAQEVIQDKLKELGPTVSLKRTASAIEIKAPASNGMTFCVEYEPDAMNGSGDERIYVGIQLSEEPYVYSDLISAQTDDKGIRLYTWDKLFDEDWQNKFTIDQSEIKDLIDFEREANEA